MYDTTAGPIETIEFGRTRILTNMYRVQLMLRMNNRK